MILRSRRIIFVYHTDETFGKSKLKTKSLKKVGLLHRCVSNTVDRPIQINNSPIPRVPRHQNKKGQTGQQHRKIVRYYSRKLYHNNRTITRLFQGDSVS